MSKAGQAADYADATRAHRERLEARRRQIEKLLHEGLPLAVLNERGYSTSEVYDVSKRKGLAITRFADWSGG